MYSTHKKEQFSDAYFCAIAASAGYQVYKPTPDIDKIDWGVAARGPHATVRSPKLELQLKCSSQKIVHDERLSFALDVASYENLRMPGYMVPRILVVVLVPEDEADWLEHSEVRLSLYRCGYWVSLVGLPKTANTDNVTVSIPRTQQFTVAALTEMMKRIGGGGMP
jgi:Domain of unknown function (DUF4365)